MTEPDLEPALFLMQQNRTDAAEAELRRILAEEGESLGAHVLLVYCLLERDALDEATAEAQRAIALGPDVAAGHAAHARVLYRRNRYAEAEESIQEALRLDPMDEGAFGLLAAICLEQRRFEEALEAADRGLAIDPDDTQCLSLRTMALERLGRGADALTSAKEALDRDPDSAHSHAMAGWAQLSDGNYREAQTHFRESLRIDPHCELARDGMIRALNSRNFLYRWMFAYMMWISRLGSGIQWAIILGLYFGSQLIIWLGEQFPAFAPIATPLIILYVSFALLSWTIGPLFNTALRLNPYGRYLLDRDDLNASNGILANLAFGLLVIIGLFVVLGSGATLFAVIVGIMTVMMLIPISGSFNCPQGRPRNIMLLATVGLFGLELWTIWMGIAGSPDNFFSGLRIFIFANLGSQFLANSLSNVTVER